MTTIASFETLAAWLPLVTTNACLLNNGCRFALSADEVAAPPCKPEFLVSKKCDPSFMEFGSGLGQGGAALGIECVQPAPC